MSRTRKKFPKAPRADVLSNPTYTGKKIIEALQNGKPPSKVAHALGVSKQRVFYYKKQLEKAGLIAAA